MFKNERQANIALSEPRSVPSWQKPAPKRRPMQRERLSEAGRFWLAYAAAFTGFVYVVFIRG